MKQILFPTRIRAFIGVTVIAVIGTIPAKARSEAFDLKPYLESNTIAVARINLERIDVPTAVAAFTNTMQMSDTERQQLILPTAVLSGFVGTLKVSGVKEVYVTLAAPDIPFGGITVWCPCADTKKVEDFLRSMVKQTPPAMQWNVHSISNAVVIAPDPAWRRLENRPAASREQLVAAIPESKDAAIVAGLNLPEHLRKELAGIWPDALPKSVPIELSPSRWAREMESLTVSISLPPSIELTAIVRTSKDSDPGSFADDLRKCLSLTPLPPDTVKFATGDREVRATCDAASFDRFARAMIVPLRAEAASARYVNNLKQIGLAMHNHVEAFKNMPLRASKSKDGKPLLSWRVHLLPFLDNQPLYASFHLDEPWDSPHNKTLIENMPQVYRSDDANLGAGMTRFVLPVFEGSAWFDQSEPLKFSSIADGTSNTVAAVMGSVEKAVIWTQPSDLELSEAGMINEIFGKADQAPFLFFDGSVRQAKRDVSPDILRALMTHRGGELAALP